MDKLTPALHAAEILVGREHELYSQIQKCIDTYYEGRLIRDEVQKAINILMTIDDKSLKYNIIAGLQDAPAANREALIKRKRSTGWHFPVRRDE